MPLELDSLKKAVAALQAVLAKSQESAFMGSLDDVARNVIRSGVIQHFEFTYELCWKFMKRWLETNISPTTADGVTRRELFRLAAEQRLITDVEEWMKHHEAHGRISQTYEPEIAAHVYSSVSAFARDAKYFLQTLEARND